MSGAPSATSLTAVPRLSHAGVHCCVQVQRALLYNKFKKDQARAVAVNDWNSDRSGETEIKRPGLYAAWFQLADVWCT